MNLKDACLLKRGDGWWGYTTKGTGCTFLPKAFIILKGTCIEKLKLERVKTEIEYSIAIHQF